MWGIRATIHRNGYVHADLNPSTVSFPMLSSCCHRLGEGQLRLPLSQILVMADGVVQIGALHKIVDAKRGVSRDRLFALHFAICRQVVLFPVDC